jgi:5-amino-6-(5-phosphoribosylamino)uracil reductase
MQPADRPHVLLSAAMSADGYIDDATARRLVLSDAADLDRVDELRAGSDAILVGAQTVRADNPALQVRSAARRELRRALGLAPTPQKVTITNSGRLDPGARFFAGPAPLVYAPDTVAARLAAKLPATVIGLPRPLELTTVLADLAARGIGHLMVEGGSSVLAQFLAAGLADELWLAIAPTLIADPAAPRLTGHGPVAARLDLAQATRVGRMAVLRYVRATARHDGQVWPTR